MEESLIQRGITSVHPHFVEKEAILQALLVHCTFWKG
jgi:hypothetical protein